MPPNVIHIRSPQDPQLVRYQREYKRKSDMRDGCFVAESQFLVQRLLDSSFHVDSIVVDDEAKIPELPPQRVGQFPIYVMSRDAIKELLGYNFHRGILACGMRPQRGSIDSVFPGEVPKASTILAASKIGDFENLGTIIRAACAFGADAVLLDEGCADPFARRSLRVSTGHAFKIPIVESEDFTADLQKLVALGYENFATVLSETATPLSQVTRAPRSVLLVGNEGYGLEETTLAHCTHQITIPMQRGSDSLNVAMATGIFLYHFCDRQATSPADDLA